MEIGSSNMKEEQDLNISVTEHGERIIKVRLNGDEDFIETDIPEDCTLEFLLDILSIEFDTFVSEIVKLRKLPNTLIRNDKDIKRLRNVQEIKMEVTSA